MYDLHVHTCFSSDSEANPRDYLTRAQALGLEGVCFTDHIDIDFPYGIVFDIDFDERKACFDALEKIPGASFTRGFELGLRRVPGIIEQNRRIIAENKADFVLGSVHVVEERDPFYPVFFEGCTRAQGYARYFEEILACIRLFDDFDVLGHMDYPAKGCPFEDKQARVGDAPDVLDAILRLLLERGQSLEINTSVIRNYKDQLPEGGILRRFVELGGEWITLGSDAHYMEQLGYRFSEVKAFAEAAGIRYLTHFKARKPVFTPIAKA